MDIHRITTFIVVLILMSSGIAVIAQSTDVDEKAIDKENVGIEEDRSASDNIQNNVQQNQQKNQRTLNKEYAKYEKEDIGIKTPTRNDFLSIKRESTFSAHKYVEDFNRKGKSENSLKEVKSTDEDKKISDSKYKPVSDQRSTYDELPDIDVSDQKTLKSKVKNTPTQEDSNEPSDEKMSVKTNLPTLTASSDGELIFDYYDITFQENMTAISIDATFSIYKINVRGSLFTADQIRNSPYTDEIMENLTKQMSEVFNKSVSSAFPEEQKNFYSSNYTVDSSPGPVNVCCSASVYLDKSSYGFDENNTELDLSDVLYGTTKMGALISKDVTLKVDPGHNSSYRIHVPEPLITTSNDTIGYWGYSNQTFDNNENRTCTWIYNNTAGNKEVELSKSIDVAHQNPLDLNKEIINATSLLNMDSFEKVNITDTLDVSTIDISGYTKPGTEESILPPNISNLDIVTSDGLRMMLDNGLTNLQDIKERSLNTTVNNFENSMENIFGEKPNLEIEWDQSTISGYDVDSMRTTPPLRCYFNSTEPVGFTNQRLDMPPEADVNEVITETLQLDAVLNPEFNMTVEDGVHFTLKILAPQNVEFKNSTLVENDRYLYQKEIDNRDGNNQTTHISLHISWSGEVRKYDDEDIGADVLMDMEAFDEVPINMTMKIKSVKVSSYGDDFDMPDTVQGLEYIDGDFIRMSVRNGLLNLSSVYNQSIKHTREDITDNLEDLFGQEVIMEFSWESLKWKEWTSIEWKERSSLGTFKAYLTTKDPAQFNNTSIDLPDEADIEETVEELLRLDATLSLDFDLTVEANRWMNLTIKSPEDIGMIGGVNQSGRWKRSWYREGGEHTLNIEMRWEGPGSRSYESADSEAIGLIDIQTFDNIDGNLNISIGAVDVDDYDDQFDIPEQVNGLNYVDGDFIRVAVRNGLVELSTIYNQSVKDSKNSMEDDMEDMFGEEASLNFRWEDQSWKDAETYRDAYPDGLGDLKAYMDLNDTVAFSPDSFDLPDEADVGELVRTVLSYDATIGKDLTMNISDVERAQVTVRTPEDIKIEEGERYKDRWSKTYTLEKGNNTVHLSLRYDGEVQDISEENVYVNGTLDMQNLDSIDVNISISISSININNYGDNLSIPESIHGLDLVDHEFIRTAVENDLIEWSNITDEMNASVDEFEKEIPDLLGDFNLTYSEAGKSTGPIRRYYEGADFKLNVTPEDDEDAYIDHELIKAIMNSGAVVDFEIPSVEDIDENYTLNLKLGTPQFMNLHDDTGQFDRQNGYYTLDMREGLNGTFRSGVEGPSEQNIQFNMNIDLHKIKINPSPLKLSYSVHAKSRVDAKVEINSVELPEDIGDSLPDEIRLSHATPGLIRQAEKHGLFDKQEILGMLRNGSGVDNFDGMNQTLRDALDNQDIGIDIAFEEGTWEYDEEERNPLILKMESEFKIHVAGSKKNSALDLYTVKMGKMEIPSIEGIDTNFRILFPEGVRAEVEENSNVNTGWTDGGRHYVEVQTSGDSNESVTIDPKVVLTHNLLFGEDLFVFNIAVRLILILIITLILLGVGIKLAGFFIDSKERIVKKGMKEARKEDGDPEKWYDHISDEDKEEYDITRNSVAELDLQDELMKQKEKAGIEIEEGLSEEKTDEEDLPTLEEEIKGTGIEETEEEDFEIVEDEGWQDELEEESESSLEHSSTDESQNSSESSLEHSSTDEHQTTSESSLEQSSTDEEINEEEDEKDIWEED